MHYITAPTAKPSTLTADQWEVITRMYSSQPDYLAYLEILYEIEGMRQIPEVLVGRLRSDGTH